MIGQTPHNKLCTAFLQMFRLLLRANKFTYIILQYFKK